jgi:hypothetical protein
MNVFRSVNSAGQEKSAENNSDDNKNYRNDKWSYASIIRASLSEEKPARYDE